MQTRAGTTEEVVLICIYMGMLVYQPLNVIRLCVYQIRVPAKKNTLCVRIQ